MTEINYSNVTPCGESCVNCEYKLNNECAGCRETNGNRCKMWTNGCDIYRCAVKHKVYHCGLCKEFPCHWLADTIGKWNSNGIEVLKGLSQYSSCMKDDLRD